MDELNEAIHPVMAYISQTMPGVTRGPHEHHEQTDYFVFIGPGDFELFLWTPENLHRRLGIETRSLWRIEPMRVSIPPGVHAYRNISNVPGWVYNGPNKLYAGWNKTEDVDEIRHELDPESPYCTSRNFQSSGLGDIMSTNKTKGIVLPAAQARGCIL